MEVLSQQAFQDVEGPEFRTIWVLRELHEQKIIHKGVKGKAMLFQGTL